MITKFSQKMKELKRVAQLHANWLVYATLGAEAITKEELSELKKYGKLPVDKSLELVDKSYLLGRLKAILKKSEYNQVTYEEVVEKSDGMDLSLLEELVVEQARLKAGTYLKNLSTELNNGVYDALSQAIGKAVSEATVRNIVSDETALAVIYKKTAQEFSSSLAARLQTGPKKAWLSIARTELHRAKVAGHAQAIINKIDIYANSDGPNSDVSIIPAKECCEDCRERYTESSGNPRIFKLTDLIAAGSNADSGVSHTKVQGKHVNWKTTLPPLHPNCGCQLQYIPPGYGWQSGKLSVLNKALFEEAILRKAVAGVSGGISSTVKPQGPYGSAKPPGMPSVPGAAAPGNVAGPGRPSGIAGIKSAVSKLFGGGGGGGGGGGSAPPGGGGGNSEYAPCPFGGGDDCIKHGGNGAEHHKSNGSIMQKHQEAMAKGAKPKTKQNKKAEDKKKEAEAAQYDFKPHPAQVTIDHLSDGKIAVINARTGSVTANDSFKVTIDGNGSGLMKPAIDYIAQTMNFLKANAGSLNRFQAKTPKEQQKFIDDMNSPGAGTIAPGTHPNSEAAAYSLSTALGSSAVPVTVLRHHDGSGAAGSPKGLTSVMQWRDDAMSIDDYLGSKGNDYDSFITKIPDAHKDKVKLQLAEVAVLDIVFNNNDRHHGNIMMTANHEVVAIDHGTSFGNGLSGHRNDIAKAIHSRGKALTIPKNLESRLRSSTLSSTMRSLDSSGIPEWSKAQAFLRQKYVLHLQDTFGHIPFSRIRGTNTSMNGGVMPYATSANDHWSEGQAHGLQVFFKEQADKTLPQDQFERWSKSFMETAAADPKHPDHADAKKLLAMQPLRSSKHVTGREPATPEALKKHFDSILSYSVSDQEIKSEKNKVDPGSFATEPGPEATRDVPDAVPASPSARRKAAARAAAAAASTAPKPTSTIQLSDEDLEEVAQAPKPKAPAVPPPPPPPPPAKKAPVQVTDTTDVSEGATDISAGATDISEGSVRTGEGRVRIPETMAITEVRAPGESPEASSEEEDDDLEAEHAEFARNLIGSLLTTKKSRSQVFLDLTRKISLDSLIEK